MNFAASEPEVYEMEIESNRVPRTISMAFGISLAMHVLLLGSLALIKFADRIQEFTQISSQLDDENDPMRFKFEATLTDQMGNDSDINTMASSQAAAEQVSKTPQERMEQTISEDLDVQAPVTEQMTQPAKADVLASVATTGATEHPGGVEGAVDRLAWEIANSLREKKTLVVWLFDVSPSLSARRAAIADRVENVYNQLNSLNVQADKALKSAVAVFGEQSTILTKDPVDDPAELVRYVRGIKSEASGNENTFAAVQRVATHFQKYRTEMHRDIMIIIVTDEAGSDPQNLENAIMATKRYGMRCYCVGDAAPFGRETTETPFTLESGEVVMGVMHRGPETLYPESLRLAYWGTNDYDLQNMSSGFGPYGLTRLCAETNGVYFIANDARGRSFDPQVMRNYAPDYRPIKMIDADFAKNKSMSSLRDVARMLKVESVPTPRLEFPAENDTILRQAITDAQRPAAEFEYKINAIKGQLEPGEKDRAKVQEARLRAGYDLAMGRVLALQARSFGYNMMLAEMKSTPKKFEKNGSNQWRLVASKDINSGATTKKLANKASEYLKRVIDEHPNTPWQMLAERELGTPMGWEWKEATYNANAGMGGGGNQKQGPKFLEVEDPVTKKKKKVMISNEPQRREI
jgi:hypothetical protein